MNKHELNDHLSNGDQGCRSVKCMEYGFVFVLADTLFGTSVALCLIFFPSVARGRDHGPNFSTKRGSSKVVKHGSEMVARRSCPAFSERVQADRSEIFICIPVSLIFPSSYGITGATSD